MASPNKSKSSDSDCRGTHVRYYRGSAKEFGAGLSFHSAKRDGESPRGDADHARNRRTRPIGSCRTARSWVFRSTGCAIHELLRRNHGTVAPQGNGRKYSWTDEARNLCGAAIGRLFFVRVARCRASRGGGPSSCRAHSGDPTTRRGAVAVVVRPRGITGSSGLGRDVAPPGGPGEAVGHLTNGPDNQGGE